MVPMFVWLTMASRPFKEDLLALHLSMPFSSSGSMVMSFALLCPQVLSQAPHHFQIFQEAGHMWGLLSPWTKQPGLSSKLTIKSQGYMQYLNAATGETAKWLVQYNLFKHSGAPLLRPPQYSKGRRSLMRACPLSRVHLHENVEVKVPEKVAITGRWSLKNRVFQSGFFRVIICSGRSLGNPRVVSSGGKKRLTQLWYCESNYWLGFLSSIK